MSKPINCGFYPVQCTEEKLDTLAMQDGYVYFTTDTKKIFLDRDNKRIPMCSATGFYYGIKSIPKDDSGAKPDPNVEFHTSEIEGSMVPEINDLILNVGTDNNPDGCFYRVKGIEVDTIKTVRLTLQGTSVGGSSGGNVNNGGVDFEIQPKSINKTFSSAASSMIIEFTPYMYNPPEEDTFIKYISCTMEDSTTPFFEKNFEDNEFRYNQKYAIDLAEYSSNFNTSAAKSFTLQVQDVRQNSHSIKCKIQLAALNLMATQDEIIYSENNSYLYGCYFTGGRSLTSRKLTFTFYNENNLTKPVYIVDYPNNIDGDVPKTLELPDDQISHGIYKLVVQGSGYISGGEKIESNIIEHKFIRFDASRNEPILTISLPSKTEQYSTIPLKMLLLTNSANKEYNIEIKINNENLTTQKITAKEILTYPMTFEDMGEYNLTALISQLNLTCKQRLVISEYNGEIPTIKPGRDDLILYLNPKGKTNNAIDRNEWKSANTNIHTKPTAKLDNFYFGEINGWFSDKTSGASYLRLSQGANLTIPNFFPFATDVMDESNYGMTIELDFKISAVTNYDADIIRCMSINAENVPYCGFRITGNKAELYTSIKNGTVNEKGVEQKPFTVKLMEDQRIKISYVIEKKKEGSYPLILTYFNGIVSSIHSYSGDDHFVQNSLKPAILSVDSSNAQIDLYGIRIYSSALDQTAILENYQASLGSLAEREANYKSNKILDNNQLDLMAIEAEDYPLEIPYIKITGGFNANKEMTMSVLGDDKGFDLPTGKKDYRLISFELKYPKTGYFADRKYEDFSEICTFESGKDATDQNPAYGETPLTGAIMYAQGTSSLEYPVKNLRVKFKTKKIKVRPDLSPVNLICLKADYMESSGSHNTGAANFVDEVYKQAGMKTPGQAYYSNESIVTAIKGHPVLVFWSTSGKEGSYKYIGKYNLNLDKATPEPFGFKNDPEKYDANAEKTFGWDENGKNTIRCFEYLDNDEEVCNFQAVAGKTYEETWYEEITDPNTGKTHYGWTEGFESRHPEDLAGKTDADDIYPMAKWVNELYELSKTDKAQALARFANEYECYFNKDFLLAYYSITNLLLMIDSRTKNCMMASWGPEGEKSYYPLTQNAEGKWVPDETQEPIKTNYFIWYPIFYDMDTMLGLDNQGHQNKYYYNTDAEPGVFNGKQILWNFVREALPAEVTNYYERFENAGKIFTASKIIPFFNNNQASLANEAMYNEDAEYKYINPYRTGYFDYKNVDADGNPTWVKGGNVENNKLFAAQGSRDLDREYFIKNRVNFLRGKYQSPQFLQEDRIEFRAYTPTASEDDAETYAKIQKTLAAVPFNATIDLEALGPGFGGIKYGNTIPKICEFTKNKLKATIEFPSATDGKNDQETYIYGLSNLKDIGDLSNKYPATFVITAENKLEIIKLGDDHKDYFNPYWQLKSSSVNFSNCPLLKVLNMYNCTYSEGLDLSKCKQLEDILLTGSAVSSLTLPEGTVIKNLRLPGTLETLSIKNQHFLENFSFGNYEYDEDEEHMTNNDHYVNNYKRIRYVEIIDTPIDSYAIAIGTPELQQYQFTNVNWNITQNDTQYVLITEEEFDSDATYYQQEINGYVEYEGTDYQFGLFRKVSLINEDGTITQIPVLEKLMRTNTRNNSSSADALTGKLHIDLLCEDGSKPVANQFQIYERYKKAYPNLEITYGDNITGTKIYTIDFCLIANEVLYSVKTDGSRTLEQLTGIDSPNGEILFVPNKTPNQYKAYLFSGIWLDTKDNNKPYYQDNLFEFVPENINMEHVFTTFKPAKNMQLIPEFQETDRYYYIDLYHEDVNIVTFSTTYETDLYLSARSHPDVWLIYEPKYQEGLEDNERVVFKGWISEEDRDKNIKNPEFLDFTAPITESNTYYSYFEKENIANPSANILFSIGTTPSGFSVAGDQIKNQIGIQINNEISGLIGQFGGKMTFPRMDKNKQDIKVIGSFTAPPTINNTEIYFAEKDKAAYEFITDSAFEGDNNLRSLKSIDLPDTIKVIGNRAFVGNHKLELTKLPTSLITLGNSAFEGCSNISISKLPSGLTKIPKFCFAYCDKINISEIGMNDEVISIGNYAFVFANTTAVTELRLGKNVTIDAVEAAGSEVFAEKGYPSLKTVYYYPNYAGCGTLEELRFRLFGTQNRNIQWIEMSL